MPGQHRLRHQGRRATGQPRSAMPAAGSTTLPIRADSRTNACTLGLRNAANRANAVARSLLWSTKPARIAASSSPWQPPWPRCGRIGWAASPTRTIGPFDQTRACRGRTGRCAGRRRGRLRPAAQAGVRPTTPNVVFRYASSPCGATRPSGRALGREPVGVIGAQRNMPAFASCAQRLAGEVRIDRGVGDAAPRGISGIAVVQRAVEVAGHNRMRAVGADHCACLSRRRVRQRDAHAVGCRARCPRRSVRIARCRSPAHRPARR